MRRERSLTGDLAAVGLVLVLGAALWLTLRTWIAPGGAPAQVGAATAALRITATPAPPPPGHNPGVADLLANAPASGASVEVDAFFDGALAISMPGGPPPPDDRVVCPGPWPAFLTDQPFPVTLQFLNTTTSNGLPDDAAWLIAASPEQTQPGSHVWLPTLPYHARLRGHLGDPAFAECASAGRIFVVEAVVQVYEQDPLDLQPYRLDLPADYAAWPRYADAAFGYSLPYPPDWQVQALDDRAVMFTGPLWPADPVVVRVHDGETHFDQYAADPASLPPLLQGVGFGVFEQGWSAFGSAGFETQGLAGYTVEPATNMPLERLVRALFSGGGWTYELALTFPTGFWASQELLTDYTGMVEGFRLDVAPGPTPTAPVQQELGAGPFLTQERVLAEASRRNGGELGLIDARLVSEAEARFQAQACATFMGHPDGVWVLLVNGQFEGQPRTMRLFLDATSGEQLCGEEIALAPSPTDTPTPAALPALSPEIYPSPVATVQAIGLEDAGCPNPAGVEAGAVLTAETALDVMRAYFSGDAQVSQQVRDPALWFGGVIALPDAELQPGWFQPPRPAAESPYAGSLRVHCGDETLAASWTVVYCRGECDAPRLSASLMEDYFLLRRGGRWLVWYLWP